MKSFIVIAALAAVGGLASSTQVRADSATDQQIVRFDRTELTTQKGLNRIYHRLNVAATVVCGDYQSSDLLHTAAYQRCVQDSVSRAVTQIHDLRLTRYHESRINPSAIPAVVSLNTPVARS